MSSDPHRPLHARRSARTGLVVLLGALVLAAAVVTLWRARDAASPAGVLDRALDAASPAVSPFVGLTEAEIDVGGACVRVVVADDQRERGRGLRGVEDPAPYSGMLFAYRSDVTSRFTMAGVGSPLDIGFYDASGAVVDRLRMDPCPGGDGCPVYGPEQPFRYALEAGAGALRSGPLGFCGRSPG